MKQAGIVAVLLVAVLIALAPKQEDARWLEEINQLFFTEDYVNAKAEALAYTQKYPKSGAGWGSLGWIYTEMNQLDEAKAAFDKAVTLDPNLDNAYVGMGVICRKQDDLSGARYWYEQAIERVPENAEAYASLLVIELKEGNYEKAVEYGERAWSIRNDYGIIPGNLSVAYHYVGNERKRDYFFNEAKRLGSSDLETLQAIFDGRMVIE